jgi:hypothetical protein
MPLVLFALLTIMITTAQGTMDAQQAGGMEALVARGFGGLVNRQATNLQVRTLSRIGGVGEDKDMEGEMKGEKELQGKIGGTWEGKRRRGGGVGERQAEE